MMPMLRVLSNGTVLAIFSLIAEKKEAGSTASFLHQAYSLNLPPIMRKGSIGLGHPVGIFLFLYRRAPAIGRINQLGRELLFHGFLATIARRLNEPAHAERQTPLWPHFDRHLISRTTDTTGATFNSGTGIFDGSFK